MREISVTLMGSPHIRALGQPIYFKYKKAEALFYYLCVKKIASRSELIRLLWIDSSEDIARARLSDMLYNIKRVLGGDIIQNVGNNLLRLNPDRTIEIDLDAIGGDNILSRYHDGVLHCFYVKNCQEFEDWLEEIRKQYRDSYKKALLAQVQASFGRPCEEMLNQYVTLCTEDEPYSESVCRSLMELCISNGQYSQAMLLYHNLREQLKRDLGINPETETTSIIERLVEIKKKKASHGGTGEVFSGRSEELYQMKKVLQRVQDGQGASILVMGESGVGKTTLLGETLKRIDQSRFIVLRRNCYQSEKELHLAPWYDILTQIYQYVKGDVSQPSMAHDRIMSLLFPYLGDAPKSFPYANDAWLNLTAGAVVNALAGMAQDKTILLVFDDIQWMDSASRRILGSILQKQGGRNIVMLAACRDYAEESIAQLTMPLENAGLLVKINLERFDRPETERIICDWMPELRFNAEALKRIYRDSEGNALYLTEMLKLLKEKSYSEQIPTQVINVIKSRLLDLPVDENQVLCAVSLFFDQANLDELKACLQGAEYKIISNLEALLGKRLLRETVCGIEVYYGFTHQKIRRFIYDTMPAGKRAFMHRRVAEYYECLYAQKSSLNGCSRLIYHYEQCGDTLKTCCYKTERFLNFYSVYHEVYPCLSQSVSEISTLGAELASDSELLTLVREVCALDDSISGVPLLKMKNLFMMGRYYIRIGEYNKGITSIEKSIAYAHALGDAVGLFNCYKQMIYYGIQAYDMERMKQFLESAFQTLEVHPELSGERRLLLRFRGLYFLRVHDYVQAREWIFSAIELCKREDGENPSGKVFLAVCYNYVGECHFLQNEFELAFQYFCMAIESAAHLQSYISGAGVFYSYAGQALYAMGRFAEAREYITSANECFLQLGAIWGRSVAESYAALIEIKTGSYLEARKHYRTACEFAEKMRNPAAVELLERVKQELEAAENEVV